METFPSSFVPFRDTINTSHGPLRTRMPRPACANTLVYILAYHVHMHIHLHIGIRIPMQIRDPLLCTMRMLTGPNRATYLQSEVPRCPSTFIYLRARIRPFRPVRIHVVRIPGQETLGLAIVLGEFRPSKTRIGLSGTSRSPDSCCLNRAYLRAHVSTYQRT